MPRLREGFCVLLLVALFATALHAEVSAADDDAHHDTLAAQVQLLSASADADAWLLGAWLAHSACTRGAAGCDTQQADRLFARVLAQPPQDALVLRVLIGQLGEFLADDPPRLAAEQARLLALVQTLEPQALSSWLPALPDLSDTARAAQGAAVLAQAARSTRTGSDYQRTFRWIAARLAQLPPDPEWAAAAAVEPSPDAARRTAAMGMVHAMRVPSFQRVSRWCAFPSSAIVDDCRAIARLLAHGDTLLERSIGVGMLERLVSTAVERAEALQAAAQTDWLTAGMQQCQVLDDAAVLARLEGADTSEIALIQAGLQARGLPIEPPADQGLRERPCGEAGAARMRAIVAPDEL